MLCYDARDNETHEKGRGYEADRCIGPDDFRKRWKNFVHPLIPGIPTALLSEIGLSMEVPRHGSFVFPIPRGTLPAAID